jgi:hypothetical protein
MHGQDDKTAFSLLGRQTADRKAKRKWSDSYLALTNGGQSNELVNWIGAQSAPPMLPPYHAGAANSRLVAMLEEGHEGAKLNREELDKVACWIDLLVPYCGDYMEAHAWLPGEVRIYNHFLLKRQRMEAIERTNIADFIAQKDRRNRVLDHVTLTWHNGEAARKAEEPGSPPTSPATGKEMNSPRDDQIWKREER